MEYVPYGDLLGFLRKSRGVEDKFYSCCETFKQSLTDYDLLAFAKQIANGMQFLASRKVAFVYFSNILVGCATGLLKLL